MTVVYTHRGFPVYLAISGQIDSVYESPEVSDIYRARIAPIRPNFAVELDQVASMTREWSITRGFFVAALDPATRIGGSVQSFIAETAMYLTGRITRRRVSFQDRGLLIREDAATTARAPSFTQSELMAITELANIEPEALIQLWITRVGVDDLSSTLQLYVGDRSRASALQ
jgi:hypothetical protein